jgi:hypothetical protein
MRSCLAAGDGNEDDGTWFVLNEAGAAVKGKATAPAAAESEASRGGEEESEESSGGGGYGY